MKIEFADDRIKEYGNGPLHFTNDGEPKDVSVALGDDLLRATHFIDGKPIKVFRAVGEKPKRMKEAKELLRTYPDNYPHAEELSRAGFTHEEAILLSEETLLEVEGIGKRGVAKIIAFNQEK